MWIRAAALSVADGEKIKMLGRYFIISEKAVIERHVDLEKLARSRGLIKPWEKIGD